MISHVITGNSFADENESMMGDRLTFIPLLTGMDGNQEFMELINPRPQSRKSSARDDERRVKQNKAAKPPPPTKRQSSKSGGKKS
mmetsp:Transcript_15364/g.27034  ORF Transcript_15364/g.27034 Transcript_15364/m.27034 type:complete len:85 (+) Transcript_15364:39-293(+)